VLILWWTFAAHVDQQRFIYESQHLPSYPSPSFLPMPTIIVVIVVSSCPISLSFFLLLVGPWPPGDTEWFFRGYNKSYLVTYTYEPFKDYYLALFWSYHASLLSIQPMLFVPLTNVTNFRKVRGCNYSNASLSVPASPKKSDLRFRLEPFTDTVFPPSLHKPLTFVHLQLSNHAS